MRAYDGVGRVDLEVELKMVLLALAEGQPRGSALTELGVATSAQNQPIAGHQGKPIFDPECRHLVVVRCKESLFLSSLLIAESN